MLALDAVPAGHKSAASSRGRAHAASSSSSSQLAHASTQLAHTSSSSHLVSLQPRKELRCYDVLGVSRFATPSEIRHAYRHKALSFHPDKVKGEIRGFLALAESFEVLSDPAQRGSYDRDLASSNSRDGLSGMELPVAASVSLHRDPIVVCLALTEIREEEWSKHLAEVPTGTLKEMHEHLVECVKQGGNLLKRSRLESDRVCARGAEDFGAGKPRHLCYASDKKTGLLCAQIQMCGIHVRTFSTRNPVTAADSHLALVSLKEAFFAKWKENGMADFEDTLRTAAEEQRAQKMYIPGAMHWFDKTVEPEPGLKWRLTTPCTRDLESTLHNRAVVLSLLNRGASKKELLMAIENMRESEKTAKASREEGRPSAEERLNGFVACELDHRLQQSGYSSRKRQRLRGKQSMTQLCVQLPWFGRFAAAQGISSTELEALLPPLQTRLRGVPSLEQCLQRALRNSLFASGQPAALEDSSMSAQASSGSTSAGGLKRKASSQHVMALGDAAGQPAPHPATQHKQAAPQQAPPQLPPPPPPPVPQPPPQQAPPQPPLQPRSTLQAQLRSQRKELHRQQQARAQARLQAQLEKPGQLQPQPPPQKVLAAPRQKPQEKRGALLGGPAAVDSGLEADSPAARHGTMGGEIVPACSAREASPVPRQQARSRPRRGWRECYSFILQELLADPEVDRLFGQPVDLEMYPDYLARISPNTPVDLRLILEKLSQEDSGYADVDECSADVSMVWENAARFNAPGSYVRAIAEQAAKIINDLLLGRRSVGRIWSRAPSQGHRSSLRPQARSRSETRSRSQLSVQFGHESSVPKTPPAGDPQLGEAVP